MSSALSFSAPFYSFLLLLRVAEVKLTSRHLVNHSEAKAATHRSNLLNEFPKESARPVAASDASPQSEGELTGSCACEGAQRHLEVKKHKYHVMLLLEKILRHKEELLDF